MRKRNGMGMLEGAAFLAIMSGSIGGAFWAFQVLTPWSGMDWDVAHDVTGAMPAAFSSASFAAASPDRTEGRRRSVVLDAKGADGSLHQIQLTPMAAYVLERRGRPEKQP